MATLTAARSPLYYQKTPGGLPAIVDVSKFSGNIFYVDSATGTDGAGYGSHPDKPVATIDYAIGLCTANQGDVILVMPGHDETLTAAITCDKAGVQIISVGQGADRAQLTVNGAIDGVTITADDVTLDGLYFNESTDSATSNINIAAARATLRHIHMDLGATDIDAITITAAGELPTIEDCTATPTANGPDSWIKFEGVIDRPIIRRNDVIGSDGTNAFDDGILDFNNQAVTNALIYDNTWGDGNAAVTVFANGGNVVGEVIGINRYAALATNADTVGFPLADGAITAAKFGAGAIDAAAVAAAAIDAATFAADALQAMQDEAQDAIQGEQLDHLVALTDGAGAAILTAVDGSIVAKIGSKVSGGDMSSFDNTTDSLEMLSDKLGALTGDGGAGQDDSVKASLDLAHTDLDTIIANQGTLVNTGGTATLGGIIGDVANVSLATRLTTIDDFLDTEVAAILVDTGTDGVVIAPDGITSAKIADDALATEHFALSAGEKTTDGIVVTKAAAALPQSTSANIFTVTGLVLLKRVIGYVTVAVGNIPNATKLKVNSTGAGATTDICGTNDIDNDAADTRYEITGTFANAMLATLDIPAAQQQAADIVCPPGTIMVDCAGSDGGGGRVRWSVTYVPLESGAQIVAA